MVLMMERVTTRLQESPVPLVCGAEQDLVDVYPVGLGEGPEDPLGHVLGSEELYVAKRVFSERSQDLRVDMGAELRLGRPRLEERDADAVGVHLLAQDLGEGTEAVLCSRVDREKRGGNAARGRGDVDDMAAAPLEHA